MTKTKNMDRYVVESIARESGFDFKHVSSAREVEMCVDVVYLLEDKKGGDECLLIWNNDFRPIKYSRTTKAAIRKMFGSADAITECAVCFDDIVYKEKWYSCCPQCNSIVCVACLTKMILQADADEIESEEDLRILKYHCVECRTMHTVNLERAYLPALDHYDELDKYQQGFLLLMKDFDPLGWQKRKKRMSCPRTHHVGIAKPIKIGTKIILHSLRNKDEWNGEIAHIIGNKVVKKNMDRWPIQLMLPPHEKTILSSANFHCLDRKRIHERLKVGTRILLGGLKSRKEWNGKIAQIIGEKTIKNGVERWPIQLVDSPNERASVKRNNLNNWNMVLQTNTRIVEFNTVSY